MVVHHELFHFLDLCSPPSPLQKRTWLAFNPPGFRYGQGGLAMQNLSADLEEPGFLDSYSTSDILEDRACVFASIMTSPQD